MTNFDALRGLRAAVATLCAVVLALAALPAAAQRINLNDGWRFQRGDVAGAEKASYDDRGWRSISVPHDWSIEDLPGQSHPFSKDGPGSHAEGYTVGGIGWYRRSIRLPANVSSKTVLLRFEAVYMDAEVWMNGRKLVRHPFGYTAFDLDVSGDVRPGDNVIAVRVNHRQPSSRWYAGSGILRPVQLEVLDRVHIDPIATFVTTPEVASAKSTVRATTSVVNAGPEPALANLTSIVVDAAGREVRRSDAAQSIAAGGQAEFAQELIVTRPQLWSTEAPNLYTLVQEVRVGGQLVDVRRTRFGIRSIKFDARRGFLLNGRRVLLRGGNIHHDNYMLGGAGIPRADRRKLEIMKAAGYNAIRNAHNPASQATLDAADELGMLVIDEAFDAWTKNKRDNDYASYFRENWRGDIDSLVKHSRNHPSVIMWSIGNEIPGIGTPEVTQAAKDLAARVRALDPTRPVTAGINIIIPGQKFDDYMSALDVVGYNYGVHRYDTDHEKFPDRVMFGSESFSPQISGYWDAVEAKPWVIGDFVWTAIDYMGEAGLGWIPGAPYPWHLAMSGEIDATGKMRPAAYYRSIYWKRGAARTAAFVAWPYAAGSLPNGGERGTKYQYYVQEDLVGSWAELQGVPSKVVVFSQDDEVELFVNGKSVGRRPVSRATDYRTTFWTLLPKGEIKAVGYRKGKPNSQWRMHSSGAPARIRLTADRASIDADGDDLAYVTAELLDTDGNPVALQRLDKKLKFSVLGPGGVLVGVGNGNPVALESFQSGERSTYVGRAVAVVRASKSPGVIEISVSGEGLESATVQVISK